MGQFSIACYHPKTGKAEDLLQLTRERGLNIWDVLRLAL